MRMMSSTIVILFSMMTMGIFYNNVLAALPLECDPGFLDDLPPRIRKICAALSKAYELGSGSYTSVKESHIPGVLESIQESIPLLDSGVKRQDDHVFLRFGRRR
ncbi:myosuppressin isoform X1 [Frieseomelitta varia]|uniref:myosuppressin isoform X1 n=2 Tax=Frieseomelitta varia TaxID=561572 RepID=UPI001CB68FDC|nr:myosuppressin isoform X1 [Frieseomelitta varia]